MNVTQWHGCYSGSWNGILVPDAFAHPAKVAPGLAYRIYRHMLDAGYIAPGDSVFDPFGGIGGFGYHALLLGLHWTGVELEPRFIDMGSGYDCPGFTRGDWRRFHHRAERVNYQTTPGGPFHWCPECQQRMTAHPKRGRIPHQEAHRYIGNIDKWRRDLAMLNGKLGTARLLQGDSRRLLEVVGGGMGAAVSSPPYDVNTVHSDSRAQERYNEKGGELGRWGMHVNGVAAQGDYGDTPGQLGSMRSGDYAAAVSSPPFSGDKNLMAVNDQGVRSDMVVRRGAVESDTQQSPGNLAALRADSAGFNAAVSSPPYADNAATWVEGPGARHDLVHHNGDNAHKISSDNGYGLTPGNVGHMRDGGFEAAVSSPPYEHSLESRGDGIDWEKTTAVHRGHRSAGRGAIADGYGAAEGNIGNDTAETFWAAARAIVEQTYAALKPGGYAAWVTKRFVRDKQIVEFSEQWAQLCEVVGFTRVEWIRAMLTESHGHQLDIFGESHPKGIKRASFFRRLYESKYPENAIDWEDVIIMRKSNA